MDIGMLLLRLLLAGILFAHATQKLFGWFQGPGVAKQAAVFEMLGLRPGRPMVVVAAVSELLGALLLALGFATPVGALAAAGTMTVAGLTTTLAKKVVWNTGGGGEYPFGLAGASVVLAFTGPGAYSVDAALAPRSDLFALAAVPEAWVGVLVLVLALLAAIPFGAVILRNRQDTAPA